MAQRGKGGEFQTKRIRSENTDATELGKPGKGRPVDPDLTQITSLSRQYWPLQGAAKPFDPKIVETVFETELVASNFYTRVVSALEFSQYLEKFLWPNFDQNSSNEHVVSIAAMINQKFSEGSEAWTILEGSNGEKFSTFMLSVLKSTLSDFATLSHKEHSVLIIFLVNAFRSLEVSIVRQQLIPLISLGTWKNLLPSRREKEFQLYPRIAKLWSSLIKKNNALDQQAKNVIELQQSFFWNLGQQFIGVLNDINVAGFAQSDQREYCERFLELTIDLLSIMVTRRYLGTLFDAIHIVARCQLCVLRALEEGRLFTQLLDMLKFYCAFEINDFTGHELNDSQMIAIHYDFVTKMQRTAFKHFPSLNEFSLCNVGAVDQQSSLIESLQHLSDDELHSFLAKLCLVPSIEEDEHTTYSRQLLEEIISSHAVRRLSQIDAINEMPLYPTEQILWDENIVPSEYYVDGCLALPKLNLQFLTMHDYLLRNLNLFRLESTYEIRLDIEDAIARLKPSVSEVGTTLFSGWARMGQPISGFRIVEVGKPKLGQLKPSSVRADISMFLNVRPNIKKEWNNLRKYDVCFLVSLAPPKYCPEDATFPQKFGIASIRGCEVEGLLDEKGHLIEDVEDNSSKFKTDERTVRVWLDTNQYQQDTASVREGGPNVYETFHVLIRRDPRENNFKAVLESIRDLMNSQVSVPDWLHDIFLGYGDVGKAHYSKMNNQIATLDYRDTFLSFEHLKASFPDRQVKASTDDVTKLVPPFKVTIPIQQEGSAIEPILVTPYVLPNRGPYPRDQHKTNTVPFTPTQIEAIRSGMQPGLTLVVGPPGTGKTDVAVQIISNIYHNFPEQRTLIVTHSNMALNQIFEKIMCLDIKEHHLLRLGRGEEMLETNKDFSRFGRVDSILQLRLDLLGEAERLAISLDIPSDVASTCETAGFFYLYHVLARWEQFLAKVRKPQQQQQQHTQEEIENISKYFPFHRFFSDASSRLFSCVNYDDDLIVAQGCMRHITNIFNSLKEIRPFELLTRQKDRSRYLLTKEARIIAMTCTHAALTRRDLVACGFKYDNVIMEESAQILEVETFIPLVLQTTQDGLNRLKRVILIGDHHQLPPVIKNMAFKKFSNMEQSLFTRFIRLNVPSVQLDAQGRARPSLCSLYQWRYHNLGNLQHTLTQPEYLRCNPGFRFEYQLIDVADFNGNGEVTPSIHFFQNLAEAEYVVATFMYMRLIGYPAHQITVLTTYNGQKELIRDILAAKCGSHPLFGMPASVETVDKYQGSQNNFILLSLVRTKHIGHLRDVRRLIVAMSRARLGLYIFARKSLFSKCIELAPVFQILLQRPTQLHLYPDEQYSSARSLQDVQAPAFAVADMPQMAHYIHERACNEIKQMYQSLPQLTAPPTQQTPAQSQQNEQEATTSDAVEVDAESRKAEDGGELAVPQAVIPRVLPAVSVEPSSSTNDS